MDVIRAMQVFEEVVRRGSFRKAADSLNLANSAISRQVSELEQWLGFKLLYRTTRALSLTDEGRMFLGEMEEILARLNTLRGHAEAYQENISGSLRLTAPIFLSSKIVATLLVKFMVIYPEVSISMLSIDRYVNLVEEGVDLAIRAGTLADSSLIARHIGDVRLHVVASPEFIKSEGRPNTPQDLKNFQCLVDTTPRYKNKWSFKADQKTTTVTVSSRVEVNNGEAILNFAKAGVGIAYLPDFLVSDPIAEGQLISLFLEFQLDPLPISLVYSQNRLMTPTLKALIDFLMHNFSSAQTIP
jgi:LysR family transcriptional regulator for bpeEF and oprC